MRGLTLGARPLDALTLAVLTLFEEEALPARFGSFNCAPKTSRELLRNNATYMRSLTGIRAYHKFDM